MWIKHIEQLGRTSVSRRFQIFDLVNDEVLFIPYILEPGKSDVVLKLSRCRIETGLGSRIITSGVEESTLVTSETGMACFGKTKEVDSCWLGKGDAVLRVGLADLLQHCKLGVGSRLEVMMSIGIEDCLAGFAAVQVDGMLVIHDADVWVKEVLPKEVPDRTVD